MTFVLPILKGPLKGKRWLLATRINFFLGTYEPEQTDAFVQTVRPGAVVYDIGAHYGYYSLLASQIVGASGQVVAVEPSPRNLLVLRQHIALNGCANVTLVESAVGNHEGEARFDNRAGSGVGRLSAEGPLTVQLTTMDALARNYPKPDVLKIDVEGAEEAVLWGGRRVLESAKPAIFLSTHGSHLLENCRRTLREFGYQLRELVPGDFLATA